MPMQAAGAFNRPISLQPFGQVPCRAVCGVAGLANSRAIGCTPRLASHPGKILVRPRKDLEQVLRTTHGETTHIAPRRRRNGGRAGHRLGRGAPAPAAAHCAATAPGHGPGGTQWLAQGSGRQHGDGDDGQVRDGSGRAHRAGRHPGRGAGCRLGPGAAGDGAHRRHLQQPGHGGGWPAVPPRQRRIHQGRGGLADGQDHARGGRDDDGRLQQHQGPVAPHARGRCPRARHAHQRSRRAMEGAGRRMQGQRRRGGTCSRPARHVWRAGGTGGAAAAAAGQGHAQGAC